VALGDRVGAVGDEYSETRPGGGNLVAQLKLQGNFSGGTQRPRACPDVSRPTSKFEASAAVGGRRW